MTLNSKGSPSERLWILAESPLPRDKERGYLFSSPMGWSYDKMLGEIGISRYYITYCDKDDPKGKENLLAAINQYCPPIIVCLDTAASLLTSRIRTIEDIAHYAGSPLTSDLLSYPHYLYPTYGPERCISDWTERQVVKSIDYGKVKDELAYFKANGTLMPLVSRTLDLNLSLMELLGKFDKWQSPNSSALSVDIETVYPKENSEFKGHPGYPVIVGIAPNPFYGVSFDLFREDKKETVMLWKALCNLLGKKDIIGQNFHSFDSWFFQMLGMPVDRFKIHDTMHMHAVLWPELSHKLEFLTRQYTRQPYYKNEGAHWSPKDTQGWKKYNALDVTVTYEVYNAMNEELKQRPYLI